MSQIEKRTHPNGKVTYRVRIRMKGLPDLSATFATRNQAKEWSRKKENELHQSRYFPHNDDKNRSFAEFVDLYIERILIKNSNAFAKHRQQIFWWRSKLGKYFLSHITPSIIARLRDELLEGVTYRKTVRSPSTVNRYLAALSKALNLCVKEFGWLKENPVLKISRPKEAKGGDRYLEQEEIARLLNTCKKSKSPYLYAIVVFALSTGARRGEILNLKWKDIDLFGRIAIFRKTKNGEIRSIALTDHLIESLNHERSQRLILSEYIFPSGDGKGPADIETAWDYAIRTAQLPNLRFHDLRHTAASHLAMNGASTLEIASILGHKTLAMVKRYSHLSTSATSKVLQRMNQVIFGEPHAS